MGKLKLPPGPARSTETLPEPGLATARSRCESPVKSPAATEEGLVPAGKLVGAPNVPSPRPSSTEKPAKKVATARSRFESPLKSPTATAAGPRPVGELTGARK